MYVVTRIIITVLGMALLSGCGGLLGPVKTPTMHTYTLEYQGEHNTKPRTKCITLLLTTPTANPGYQNKKMIYSTKPYELSGYANNQWAGPPAEMLTPMLIQAIRDTGHFHAVISSPISASSNIRLKINVLELRHDFTCNPSRVRLGLQATLVSDNKDVVLASSVFREEVQAPSQTPYGGVIAANLAANRVLHRIANFCVQQLIAPNILKNCVVKAPVAYADISLPQPTLFTR